MIQKQLNLQMPVQDNDIQAAVDALSHLESVATQIIPLLNDASMMQPLAIYSLPLRNSVAVPEVIPVTKLTGEEGRSLATEAITSIRLRAEQSSRETLRVPGVLWLHSDLEEAVSRLTYAKQQFEMSMKRLHSPAEQQNRYHPKKRRFLQLQCAKALSLKQAYRIPETTRSLKTVSFYWDTSFSISRIKVCDLRERLLTGLNHISAVQIQRFDETERISDNNRPARQLANDIDLLGHYDANEVLAECWPKSPHPRAYILTEEGRHISHMSTPLLYVADQPPETVSILDRRFQDWVSSGQRPIHQELIDNPLIERLGIYRFKSEYRTDTLPEKQSVSRRKSMASAPS